MILKIAKPIKMVLIAKNVNKDTL